MFFQRLCVVRKEIEKIVLASMKKRANYDNPF
jgi:hypothetical protein